MRQVCRADRVGGERRKCYCPVSLCATRVPFECELHGPHAARMNQERCAGTPASPAAGGLARGGGAESTAGTSSALHPHFTMAANAVTHLYRAGPPDVYRAGPPASPDRARFAIAANSVTSLYRAGEAEAMRSYHRGCAP